MMKTIKTPTFIHYLDNDSIYSRLGFFFKFLIFIVISIFGLMSQNLFLNFLISFILFSLITLTGFTRARKSQLKGLLFPIILFSSFWLLLSRVEGGILIVAYPWGSFVTQRTLEMMFLAISKWFLILFSGLFFLIITSEEELIDFFNSLRFPRNFIYMVSIAFNTVGFAIRDLETIEHALLSRGFKLSGVVSRLKKMYHISSVSLLSNLNKIDTMNQSFVIMNDSKSKIYEQKLSLEIKINELTYEGKEKPTIKNLKFNIREGTVLGVYGKTGCGKTTILKTISGITPNIQPSKFKGSIKVNGEKASFEQIIDLISFGFQEAENQFIFNRVSREILSRLSTDLERENARKLIEYFGLKRIFSKSLRDISTGQRKAIALVLVLSRNKKLIILDEPTSNLDDEYKEKFLSYLKNIKKDKIIIIATHDKEIIKACNRFLFFDEDIGTWKYLKKFPQSFFKFSPSTKKYNQKFTQDLISFKNVSYKFPDNTLALKDATFDIKRGEIVGIVGKNGSGKTSLVNLMVKRMEPTKGNVEHHSKIEKIGFIHQEPQKQLFTNSIKNEIIFGSNKKYYLENELIEIMKKTELDRLGNEHPFFISRGQKQLLLISSILATRPDIIVMDEPFTGIDMNMSAKILKLISEIHKEYTPTIIMTDQNGEMIDNIITKKIILDRGMIKNN